MKTLAKVWVRFVISFYVMFLITVIVAIKMKTNITCNCPVLVFWIMCMWLCCVFIRSTVHVF